MIVKRIELLVPNERCRCLVKHGYRMMLTLNARKIGRRRRGSMMLYGFEGKQLAAGDWLVTLVWRRAPQRVRVANYDQSRWCRLPQVFNFCDHRKLLKVARG